jgi:hypothetical protein
MQRMLGMLSHHTNGCNWQQQQHQQPVSLHACSVCLGRF